MTQYGGGQKWTYIQIVKDKALRLLLPGLVFSIVAYCVKILFPGEVDRQTSLSFQDISHSFLYPYDNPLRELWFIVTLFWLMMLAPFWKVITKREWSTWFLLCVLIVLNLVNYEIELLCIGRVLSFSIWFYLGIVLSKKNIVEEVFETNFWLVLVIGIIIYIGGRHSHSFITTIGGITLSFGLAIMADKYVPRLFFTFRNYTYQIFLIGIFAQIAVKIVYRHMTLPYFSTYLLCILGGIYIPVVVSYIIKKTNFRPLLLCVGMK